QELGTDGAGRCGGETARVRRGQAAHLRHVIGVLPVVDVLLGQVESRAEETPGKPRAGRVVAVAATRPDSRPLAWVAGSPGQAATLARVRASNTSEPCEVNVTSTVHCNPFWSSWASALWTSSPGTPTSCGWK